MFTLFRPFAGATGTRVYKCGCATPSTPARITAAQRWRRGRCRQQQRAAKPNVYNMIWIQQEHSVCIYIIYTYRGTTRLYIYIMLLPSTPYCHRVELSPRSASENPYTLPLDACAFRVRFAYRLYVVMIFFSIDFNSLHAPADSHRDRREIRSHGRRYVGWLYERVSGEIYARGSSDAIESTAIFSSTIAASITRSPWKKHYKNATDATW